MDEQGQTQKTVSWATVLFIAGAVFLVIGLVARTPAVLVLGAALMAAGAVTQLVTDRRQV